LAIRFDVMGLNDLPSSDRTDVAFDRGDAIPPIDTSAYGTGVCRRRIRLVNVSDTLVVGELEDDFHHFRIELTHDGETIIRAEGRPLRGPWSTCMDAADPLRSIEGNPLSERSTAVGGYAEATSNCTHLFDLTGLAIAHATRSARDRQYDFAGSDPVDGRQELVLWRDGQRALRWQVVDGEITAPTEWVGAPLARRFIPWAEDSFDPDTAEAAIALRRMLHITIGRGLALDHLETAAEDTEGPVGRCYSYSAPVAVGAIRRKGSVRDFQDPTDARLLLADMDTRQAELT
jgi:hypothetical protein